MDYRIPPGLYAVGNPAETDPVLVTANYKLTFDKLRQELNGLHAWVLVADTRGINVWCAAGKGTFSAEEVIRRLRSVGLEKRVTHRTLVLPQLAAPGVCAHTVKRETGFSVVYGPVRARDIPTFFENGMKATAEMRTVRFLLLDRLVLIPLEFVSAMKYFLIYLVLAVLLSFALGKATPSNLTFLSIPVLGAMLIGTVAVPLSLPYIPFRSFALKGWALGLPWAAAASVWAGVGHLQFIGDLLLLPVLSAGYALVFTGCTTFTSQTGVNQEIRLFARPMAVTASLGVACMAANWVV
jgi:hypothetical protein